MVFFTLLGAVVLLAITVVGFLFYLLQQESKQKGGVLPEIQAKPEPLAVQPVIPSEYVMKETAYQKRVLELEQDLQNVSQRVQQQSDETLAMIEGLKKENEQLKSERNNQETAAQANLIKAQETITTLQEEQTNLQTRLSEIQAQVAQLKEENQTLQRSLETVSMERSKPEDQELKKVNDELSAANQKFKELNEQLAQQNEVLQWEMTKIRAHVSGLERVSENYQQQLKEALNHKEEYSRSGETDKQLQSVIEQLQQENQELTKREKLCKFELEKNRNQLVALERDYEQLKATTNQSHGGGAQ